LSLGETEMTFGGGAAVTAVPAADVAVIGAGPAGLMAAIAAAGAGARVTVVERNARPGRKLMLTGGGRCNVTHQGEIDELIAGMPGNGRFLYPAFSAFSNRDLIELLSRHGVSTIVESDGRVFPESERARSVLEALESELVTLGASLRKDATVVSISTGDGAFSLNLDSAKLLTAARVIVATGGLSYPGTGSTGDGLTWAAAMGHRLIQPRPALVGLETGEAWSKSIPGLALRDVTVTLSGAGRIPAPVRGDILFTHFGVSGPPVLNLSRFAVRALAEPETTPALLISNAENLTLADWEARLRREFAAHPKRSLAAHLAEWWPRRLAEATNGLKPTP
jgi:predicted Rossmann fold flavoprotein